MKFLKFRRLGSLSTICLFSIVLFLNGSISANASGSQTALSISRGGTNANTVEDAQTNLGKVNQIINNTNDTTFPSAKAVYDLADDYVSPGKFVVTNVGKIYISNNNLVFKKILDSDVSILRGLAFGNKKFVATGTLGRILYSYDGINWQDSNVASEVSSTYITNIAYGQNKFIALAETGQKILISDDGINFTTVVSTGINYAYNIIYANNKWVLVGAGHIAVSDDGLNWTTTFSAGNTLRGITFGQGKFIVGGQKQLLYSYDGITWHNASTSSAISNIVHGLAYSNALKIYVGAVYQSNQSLFSSDGINWQTGQLPDSVTWNNVTYGAGKFVATGGKGHIIYSYDGINWAEATPNIDDSSTSFGAIVYVKDREL
ncbi:MAG: hypothetical protein LBT91_02990 [Bifidobacteriaceae bacterium]|jgi:hypothetical protein|nr:hypothetical protein [Bifidobacteriaceae bacterium]